MTARLVARRKGPRVAAVGNPALSKPRTRRRELEHALQVQVRQWLEWAILPPTVWTAVDHAAKLSKRQGGERKARGVKMGQADFRFVLGPTGRSAEIELKVGTNTQSREQESWQAAVQAAGGLYAVCYSLEEVQAVIAAWRVPSRQQSSFAQLLANYAAQRGISVRDLCGRDRRKFISEPRQDFMLLAYEAERWSLPQIGRWLGGRDHTTILHGIEQARARRDAARKAA